MALGTPKATDFQKSDKQTISQVDTDWTNSGLSYDFKDRFYSAYNTYNPDNIKDTFWDKFSNFFGARSSADVLRMEAEQRRREAVNQLVNQKGEQDYNDPLQQAMRERQAGVNPDLAGNVSPSTATEGTEPETPMNFSGLKTGADYAQKFAGAFTTAMGIYSGIQNIQSKSFENQILKAEAGDKIFELGRKRAETDVTPKMAYMLQHPEDFNIDEYEREMRGFANYDNLLYGYGIRNKKHQHAFIQGYEAGIHSIKGATRNYKNIEEYFRSKDDSYKAVNMWYRNGNPFDIHNEKGVQKSIKAWADFLHNTEILSLNFQNKQSKFGIKEYEENGYHYNDLDFKKKIIREKKKLLDTLLKGNDTFSRILAIQLMGETDLVGNSGLGQFMKTTADIIF